MIHDMLFHVVSLVVPPANSLFTHPHSEFTSTTSSSRKHQKKRSNIFHAGLARMGPAQMSCFSSQSSRSLFLERVVENAGKVLESLEASAVVHLHATWAHNDLRTHRAFLSWWLGQKTVWNPLFLSFLCCSGAWT